MGYTWHPLSSSHSLPAPIADCDPASSDVFIAKLKTDLSGLVYCSYINQAPGSSQKASWREECAGLAIYDGDIFISGETDSPGFPTSGASVAFDSIIGNSHTQYSGCPPPMVTDFHDAFLVRVLPGVGGASIFRYGTFFGGDNAGPGATEAGNRGRSVSVFTSGTYAGMAIFSGVTTAPDFALLTSPGAFQQTWLTAPPTLTDMRAGFVAIHDTN
jgi:hypothetical protein